MKTIRYPSYPCTKKVGRIAVHPCLQANGVNMSSRLFLALVTLATVLATSGSPLLAATPDLRAERSGADVVLSWTGGVPEFRLYRAGDPATVLDRANRIGETTDRDWLDAPPASQVWFYRVESGATCYPVNADTDIDPTLSFMNFDRSHYRTLGSESLD
jgi:hypothetical protein